MLTGICAALGYRHGPLTADAVLAADGTLYLIEIAARLGGNGLAELVESAYGVDLVEAMVTAATGGTPQLRPHPPRHRLAAMLATEEGGQVLGVEGIEQVQAMPEVERLHLFARPGSVVRPYEQAGHKLGYAILRGDSLADLLRAERALTTTLAFRLAVPDDAAVGWP